jgi:predicted glycosyltransferase
MRVWIDLANSPHVPLAAAIARRLLAEGHAVELTARDHAQTVDLAARHGLAVKVVGGSSPAGRIGKAGAIAARAAALRRFAARAGADVAFSHGSYAQVAAARAARVPAVTMMDYEHQPANHVSFRLAHRVIVPDAFPASALRRFGARERKVVRYPGFKELLYLSGFRPDPVVLEELRLDPRRVLAVFRPPPEGALYHRIHNERFDELLARAANSDGVDAVLLPRDRHQRARYSERFPLLHIPEHAVDGSSLVALADLTVGGGGTMNRESALLGTPTYTVFAGRMAAVDVELMRRGLLFDLRSADAEAGFVKKRGGGPAASPGAAEPIYAAVRDSLTAVARRTR